jgi:hypothetical protein
MTGTHINAREVPLSEAGSVFCQPRGARKTTREVLRLSARSGRDVNRSSTRDMLAPRERRDSRSATAGTFLYLLLLCYTRLEMPNDSVPGYDAIGVKKRCHVLLIGR